MPFTQADRLIKIETPLGEDVLLLKGFWGQEGISQLFRFDLDLMTEGPPIDFNAIVGQNVTIHVELPEDKERYFNGYISRFAQTGSETGIIHYRAEVVPWLWFLTRTADCRIFQNKTVPDIIQKIFQDLGFSEYRFNLNAGTYNPREYCVQYRETDFNFVTRLMEQYGIFFFFEHEAAKHTLVMADAPSVHQTVPTQPHVHWEPVLSAQREDDVVYSLEFEKEFRPGKFAHTDYNFKTPSTSLAADEPSVIHIGGNDRYEIYDYPGEYPTKADGATIAKVRIQEEEAKHFIITGRSTCRAFTSGFTFNLLDYKPDDLNQAYLLTHVVHVGSVANAYATGAVAGVKEDYANTFTCIPASVPFRPSQVTPKPIIQGSQTAVITGPAGEEIWTDNYGRVKVQFHWDREGQYDENSSCWIRVSQVHAGKGFGGIDTPRIGEEVIVGFLEGDPDRPIIVGRVYNAQNMPPNGLPGAGMISGLKSNSTPGGGGNNCIMMDDTKGNELYSMNAQFNCTENVGNDRTTTIGVNESLSVGTDRSETVGSNETIQVGADQKISVGANQTIDVGAAQTETIGASCSQSVGSSKTETISVAKALSIGAAYQVSVGAAMNETVGAAKLEEIGGAKVVGVGGLSSENVGVSKSTNAGSNISEKAGGNISENAGGNISEKAGGNISSSAGGKMSLDAGGDFSAKTDASASIDAASSLVLKCGGASITLKSGGEITIKGTDIVINGSKIGVKSSGDVIIKGSTIKQN